MSVPFDDFYEVAEPWGVRPGEDAPRTEGADMGRYDEAKHPRTPSGQWAPKGTPAPKRGGAPRSTAADRRTGHWQTPEQKARVAAVLREQNQGYVASGMPGYQAAMKQDTSVGRHGRRPQQADFASHAPAHEAEIRKARHQTSLPGRTSMPGFDLDAIAEEEMNRRVEADAATKLAAFEQLQANLRAKGSRRK